MRLGIGKLPDRSQELVKIYTEQGKLYVCTEATGLRYYLAKMILPKKYKIVEAKRRLQ